MILAGLSIGLFYGGFWIAVTGDPVVGGCMVMLSAVVAFWQVIRWSENDVNHYRR